MSGAGFRSEVFLVLAGVLFMVGLILGCSSTSATTSPLAALADGRVPGDSIHRLARGMDKVAVLELLGSPSSSEQHQNRRQDVEVWIYRLADIESYQLVADGITDVAHVDQETGEVVTRPEYVVAVDRQPDPHDRRELRLTFRDGKLDIIDRNIGGQPFPW